LRVAIVGYLRPETNFDGLESLVRAIKKDISDADKLLDNNDNILYKSDKFFFS
jgi:riboflavin kinase